MIAPLIDLAFPHSWRAEILASRPLILPSRHFVYPHNVEEIERGALELMVHPEGQDSPFLATCALGFRDPVVPTGIWSMPNALEICAVSGGYAYVIDTRAPERFTMLPFRPVLLIRPLVAHNSHCSQPGNQHHRRILHLEFAACCELPDGYEWHDFVSI